MKRGIIRIIAGIVLIILQLLSLIGKSSASVQMNESIWFNIGYYGVGIAGVILLVFGLRALNKGLFSQLVLHRKTKKIHSITKWIMFCISSLLFAMYTMAFFSNLPQISLWSLLLLFATLSFSIYLLLYAYKKPSCLFSTALIFTGAAYLYNLICAFPYLLSLSYMNDFGLYMTFAIVPRFFTGILYIVIATMLYKECFSVKVIKVLGWTAFVLECSNRILCDLFVFQDFYFLDISAILFILLTAGWFLYLSVFDINALENTMKVVSNKNRKDNASYLGTLLNKSEGKCDMCGFVCDKIIPSKFEIDMVVRHKKLCEVCMEIYNAVPIESLEAITTAEESNVEGASDIGEIQFCRKCGNELLPDSIFCNYCGTKIVTNETQGEQS